MSRTAFQHAASEFGGQLSIIGVAAVIVAMPLSLFAGLWQPIITICIVLVCIGFALFFLGTWVWNFHSPTRSHIGDEERDHLDSQR